MRPASQPDAPAPEAARQAILAAAEGRGWREVDGAWMDGAGLSDTDMLRPGIEGALDGLRRRKGRALVVAKRDPVARALRDVARLMDVATGQYWALVALAVDVRARHGRFVVATFAPYERRFLGDRSRAAVAARRAAGLYVGRRPAVPEDIVRRIVSERQGGASLYTIAGGLNAEGIRGSAGGRWYASTVRFVLISVERDAKSRSVSGGR